MTIRIDSSSTHYSSQRVNISSDLTLIVNLRYIELSDSWYLDLFEVDGVTPILTGLKLMPNQNLTYRYDATALQGGDFWCLRRRYTKSPVSRFTFGPDKEYALYWITDAEQVELNIDGKISI
jgi:hypothetical protein